MIPPSVFTPSSHTWVWYTVHIMIQYTCMCIQYNTFNTKHIYTHRADESKTDSLYWNYWTAERQIHMNICNEMEQTNTKSVKFVKCLYLESFNSRPSSWWKLGLLSCMQILVHTLRIATYILFWWFVLIFTLIYLLSLVMTWRGHIFPEGGNSIVGTAHVVPHFSSMKHFYIIVSSK